MTLEAVKDSIDLNTFGLMAAVGKIELGNIRERARMGARGRAARGLIHGTPKFGYAIDSDHKPIIQPEEAEVVRQIFAWRASGMGSWEISRRLNDAGTRTRNGNPWDDQKLWWIIVERTYTGRGRYGRRQYIKKDNGDRDRPDYQVCLMGHAIPCLPVEAIPQIVAMVRDKALGPGPASVRWKNSTRQVP